ncbi:hypothetical protein ARAM_000016 [Aspergillus rambellii]|uniref:Zn(2)-C6 fungal-type domain-containing protein n=2 Tax=Aspergillus subgen. Nidulantes TaxID=2720870 RepID=A0A0F8V5M5_9EURO|nr:hypothetical protein ARAM_000016 [Aspergillus rambellii]
MSESRSSNRSLPSVPRKHRRGLTRSAAACERCRRRKQKCDGKTPTCSTCRAVGATCVPSDRLVVKPVNTECQCDLLRTQLEALQNQYQSLLGQYEQLQVQLQRAEEALQQSTSIAAVSILPPTKGNVSDLVLRVPGQESQRLDPDLSYHGRIIQPTFSPRSYVKGTNHSALSSAWDLWGDDLPPLDETSRASPVMPQFDNEAYLNLANTFFDYRWPYLPVLHKPTFLREHLTPFLSHSISSAISNFLVNLVCAIAATEKPWSQQGNGQIHRLFFRRAIQDLHVVIETDDFECVQCLLLLCLYGHNEPQSINIWYTTGLALKLALGMDLHRKESLDSQSIMRAEMSKRVFWAAFVMDCNMAINMGRPLGIRESDITMPPPLPLLDDQLDNPPTIPDFAVAQMPGISAFIHTVKLRKINAAVYETFHSIGRPLLDPTDLHDKRKWYFSELNQWLIDSPRFLQTASTYQSPEWFLIAFHHGILSLHRPSRAAPIPSPDDLRICMESSIGLISSYSALYARNRIKYTFVSVHSLFLAAVTMLYVLRASPPLRHELTRPVVQTNILTFLTIFRGISNGRAVGEKCANIIEHLGDSILTLFNDNREPGLEVDTAFQSWFGLRTHSFPTVMQASSLEDENTPA